MLRFRRQEYEATVAPVVAAASSEGAKPAKVRKELSLCFFFLLLLSFSFLGGFGIDSSLSFAQEKEEQPHHPVKSPRAPAVVVPKISLPSSSSSDPSASVVDMTDFLKLDPINGCARIFFFFSFLSYALSSS